MSTEHSSGTTQPAPVSEESRRRGYEIRDVRVRVIVGLVVAVALLIVGSQWGLSALLSYYRAEANRSDTPPTPLDRLDEPPPPPRLQSNPARDLVEFQAEQDRRLESYGWVDRKKGVVHIPISRAIDILLERGLPKAKPAAEEERNP